MRRNGLGRNEGSGRQRNEKWERRKDKREQVDIWSYCSHLQNQESTPSTTHTPDSIGDINILWAI